MNFKEYRKQKNAQPEQIEEQLTQDEAWKVDRMQGSGRDYYLSAFHASHPAFHALLQQQSPQEKRYSVRIPIQLEDHSTVPHPDVINYLQEKGYHTSHDSYKDGIVHKQTMVGAPDRGIPMREKVVAHRIGKVLDDHAAPNNIKKAFMQDTFRTGAETSEYDAILTAHHHDIAGGSTGRGWISCANIRTNEPRDKFKGNGTAAKKIPDEINNMTHHMYLVPRGGNVDTDAIARTQFKLHKGVQTGHETLIPDNIVYGTPPNLFGSKQREIVSSLFSKHDGEIYKKNSEVYHDNGQQFHFPEHISPEALDAAWKATPANDERGQGELIGRINPDHTYKARTLNAVAKSVQGIRTASESGNFENVVNAVSDAHYATPQVAHNEIEWGDKNIIADTTRDAIKKTFDPRNPVHLEHAKRLGYSRDGILGVATREAISNIPPAKTFEEYDAQKNLQQSGFMLHGVQTNRVPLAHDHDMGKNPLDHITQKLSETNSLNHEQFRHAYLSSHDQTRIKGNLYDHAVRLRDSGVDGMSAVVEHLAKDVAKRRGDDKASTYYHCKPATRQALADINGDDHKKVMKDFPDQINKIKESRRMMNELTGA